MKEVFCQQAGRATGRAVAAFRASRLAYRIDTLRQLPLLMRVVLFSALVLLTVGIGNLFSLTDGDHAPKMSAKPHEASIVEKVRVGTTGNRVRDFYRKTDGQVVWRRIEHPSGSWHEGAMSKNGRLPHGEWTYWDNKADRQRWRWYWYGELISEGEWLLRSARVNRSLVNSVRKSAVQKTTSD